MSWTTDKVLAATLILAASVVLVPRSVVNASMRDEAAGGATRVPAEAVRGAYELRMKGKADEAKALLEQIVSEHPGNALAWYELARTQQQIGLGRMAELFGSLESIQRAVEKAVEIEPKNLSFSSYRAYFCFFRAYADLRQQKPDAQARFDETVAALEYVLDLKPDYYPAAISLIELHRYFRN